MNDETALQESGNGNRAAFRLLFDRYAAALLRFAQRMVGPRPESEELLQEVMLRIWSKAPLFDPARGKARTWMYQVARRTILNHLAAKSQRQAGREIPVEMLPEMAEAGMGIGGRAEPGPEQIIIQREDSRQVLAGLERLPEDLKEILVLRFIEGMSVAEMAQIIECPEGTVKSRVFYGLRKLREIMNREAENAPN